MVRLLIAYLSACILSTSSATSQILVVGATGGLGQSIVREALSRGHTVSVLARDSSKLSSIFRDIYSRLNVIHIGDARNASLVATAATGQDVIFGTQGGDPLFARVLAEQAKAAGSKFIFVAGATNVMAEDGVTPNYVSYLTQWAGAEGAYRAHGACIDEIRNTGVNFVVFCPGFMSSTGSKSPGLPAAANIRVNRPSGNYVSYEDAAFVMLEAAEASLWDGMLITASTTRPGKTRAEL